MKIITDALPTMLIILRTTCCPTKAAILATAIKYSAETYPEKIKQVSKQVNGFPGFFIMDSLLRAVNVICSNTTYLRR